MGKRYGHITIEERYEIARLQAPVRADLARTKQPTEQRRHPASQAK